MIARVPIGAKIRSALNRFVVLRGMRAPVQAAFIVGELFLIIASIGCTPHFQSEHCRGRLSDQQPVPLGTDRGALTFSAPIKRRSLAVPAGFEPATL